MTHYTIYDTSTGEILGGGSTNVTLGEIALETGQSIIEGTYNVGEYKIIDGAAVAQTVSIWDILKRQNGQHIDRH